MSYKKQITAARERLVAPPGEGGYVYGPGSRKERRPAARTACWGRWVGGAMEGRG